jgi:CheY-like chemotaxis protein
LIVDDEKALLKLFRMILRLDLPETEVDVALNGEEAVEIFRDRHHAVLLMDLHMPVMDGRAAFFAIEEYCREQGWEMPAVVFCTGFAPPDAVSRVVESNPAHCLLAKPVTADLLVNTIRSRLGAA